MREAGLCPLPASRPVTQALGDSPFIQHIMILNWPSTCFQAAPHHACCRACLRKRQVNERQSDHASYCDLA